MIIELNTPSSIAFRNERMDGCTTLVGYITFYTTIPIKQAAVKIIIITIIIYLKMCTVDAFNNS